jgi:hypothetical protein
MSYRSFIILWRLAIIVTSTIWLAGCVRDTALFRKWAEHEDKKLVVYTEEALKKSPDLQELDRICTKEVPTFEGFVLRVKRASPPKSTYLTYFFDSGADYRKVKSFYLDYFARNGWKLTDEYDGNWGSKSAEFRKGNYRVILYHKGMGDAEYAFHCEMLSDSGQRRPNKAMQPTAK